jgi:Carboxypeptidase regulatory-like domain
VIVDPIYTSSVKDQAHFWPPFILLLSIVCLVSDAMAQQPAKSLDAASCARCPQWVWLPISGTVTDASTGKPIAQARVTYRSRRVGSDGKELGPSEQQGEVRTADDGSFTLPLLLHGGMGAGYEVRVAAPGYLSASQRLHEHAQGLREPPPPKPPASFCMARYGKPDCELNLPDGNFRLTPSRVELQQMSEAAQEAFGLPKEDFLEMPPMRAAALSADGSRLAMLAVFPHTVKHMADPPICVGWTYDFSTSRLLRIEPQLPAQYCEGPTTSLDWDGDTVVLHFDQTKFEAQKIETVRETMRWVDGVSQAPSVEQLPGLIDHTPTGFAAKDNEVVLDDTDDGRFVVVEVSEHCRQCNTTVVMFSDRTWQLRLNPLLGSFGAIPDYWLDRANDRLILIAASEQGEKQIGVQIVDLVSHESRFDPLPAFRGRPALVAARFLDDGGARVAYTTEGACDPFSPDAPYELPSYEGGPSRKLSLCLAALPAAGADSAQQTGR